jgi:hypothetical protein
MIYRIRSKDVGLRVWLILKILSISFLKTVSRARDPRHSI